MVGNYGLEVSVWEVLRGSVAFRSAGKWRKGENNWDWEGEKKSSGELGDPENIRDCGTESPVALIVLAKILGGQTGQTRNHNKKTVWWASELKTGGPHPSRPHRAPQINYPKASHQPRSRWGAQCLLSDAQRKSLPARSTARNADNTTRTPATRCPEPRFKCCPTTGSIWRQRSRWLRSRSTHHTSFTSKPVTDSRTGP